MYYVKYLSHDIVECLKSKLWKERRKAKRHNIKEITFVTDCLKSFQKGLPFLLYFDAKRLEDNQPTILCFHGEDVYKLNTFYLELI